MKIGIFGSTGFVGKSFINALITKPVYLRLFSRHLPRSIPTKTGLAYIDPFHADLDSVKVADLHDLDIIVNLAAHSANHPYDILTNCIRYNTTAALRLYQTALDAGVKAIVHIGSYFEYGTTSNYGRLDTGSIFSPTASYPLSKALASRGLQQLASRNQFASFTDLKLFQVYGKGEQKYRLYPSLLHAARCGDDFTVNTGSLIRDFINVSLVGEIMATYVTSFIPVTGHHVHHICNEVGLSVEEFCSYWWSWSAATGKLTVRDMKPREGSIPIMLGSLTPTIETIRNHVFIRSPSLMDPWTR